MLKAIEAQLGYEDGDFESIVRAFENAVQSEPGADIDNYLPDESCPNRSSVLRELIRLDMEFSWARGAPHRLSHFQRRYPGLFADRDTIQEIAFEEYRLRLASGERPAVTEYSHQYGIDCADWPQPEEIDGAVVPDSVQDEVGQADATRVLNPATADQEMQNAALAYTVFRLSKAVPGSELSEIEWSNSVHSENGAADFFRELHQSDPDAACRLAQAAAGMPEAGSRFLDFELLSELGRGTFGRVFLARQTSLAGRLVAIKITAELSVESKALAQLQHTHIVPVYSVHRSGPFHAVVMPYFGSATLVDLLHDLKGQETQPQSGTALVSTLHAKIQGGKARSQISGASVPTLRAIGTVTDKVSEIDSDARTLRNPVAPSEVLQTLGDMSYVQALLWLGNRIADALAHAHERGILHRDLKPANILLTDQGPMLLDFNLAADTKSSTQASAARLGGTLPYMAPEHLEAFRDSSRPVDGRCDIYSLGVILYELLTGRRPYPTPRGQVKDVLDVMIKDRRVMPFRLSSLNRSVSPAVEAIIERCLQPDPAHRYQTARQLHEDLHRHLNDLPLTFTPEPSFHERAAKWYRRNRKNVIRTVIGSAAVAIFALAGLTVNKERERAQTAASDKEQEFHNQFQHDDIFSELAKNQDSEQRQRAIERGKQVLDQYGVLTNPNWQKQAAVSQLNKTRQTELLSDMGQLLVLLTQAELKSARTSKAAKAQLENARLYSDRAENCYARGSAPRVLREMQAELAGLSGDKERAEQFFKIADSISSESSSSRQLLALYELSKDHLINAMSVFKQLTQQEPGNQLTWAYLGNGYYRMARYSDALTCYSVCVALAPEVSRYHYDRGMALFNLRDFRGALTDFDEVLRREPNNFDALMARGLTKQYLQDYTGAIADLDSALNVHEAPLARIHFLKSTVHAAFKNAKAADEENDLGLKSPANTELDWIARGMSERRSHPERALHDLDEALKLNPESLSAMRNKALVLSSMPGRLEDAVAVLNRALKLYPESVLAFTARGTLLARLGKRDMAVKDAEAALRLDSQPSIRYRVAGIYASASRLHAPDAKLALSNLAVAFKSGYGVDLIETDPDLNPIKSLPEFQKLWAAAQAVRDAANGAALR